MTATYHQHLSHESDLGNGARLAFRHGHNIRYVVPWKAWIVWTGERWQRDDTFEVYRMAHDTINAIYTEAATLQDKGDRESRARFAIRSEDERRIQNMVNTARQLDGMSIGDVDLLDADPWLVNFRNGTLDLRTGQLGEHRREDLVTKVLPYEYDPAARCPQWEEFLARVVPDPDVRAYLQRAVGYSLTGDVSEQCLFFLYGTGQNGKSTFLSTIQAVLGATASGGYSLQASPTLLVVKRDGAARNDVAALRGARCVVSVETEQGANMAEAVVKEITGGDKITARNLYENYSVFSPTHKVWLASNHMPTIKGNDQGIWRRIKCIPFTQHIPDHEKDARLPEKLLAETAGIMAWIVRGCMEWRRQRGLGEPEAVRAMTAEYRSQMDGIGTFLTDVCRDAVGSRVSAKVLYDAYKLWAEETGERPESMRVFGEYTKTRCKRSRDSKGQWYHDIRLLDVEEPHRP